MMKTTVVASTKVRFSKKTLGVVMCSSSGNVPTVTIIPKRSYSIRPILPLIPPLFSCSAQAVGRTVHVVEYMSVQYVPVYTRNWW